MIRAVKEADPAAFVNALRTEELSLIDDGIKRFVHTEQYAGHADDHYIKSAFVNALRTEELSGRFYQKPTE